MTISIWRYSHLILAVLSSIFILIASLTGAFLAFEPISNQLKPYAIDGADDVSLAETLVILKEEYQEVFTVKIDKNDFVNATVITKEGESDNFYVNPITGEKLGDIIKKSPIFEFATNLHRSLFLKSTGRILIGVVSFLLFVIAITGIKLILKRQGGFKKFFSKVVKENFEQYYHVVIGRYALIPIVIITLTGVLLSLEKFDLLPNDKIVHNDSEQIKVESKLELSGFKIFQNIKLENVKSIEFPFSDDVEDYFIVKLKSKELRVNQYTGEVVSNQNASLVDLITDLSLILHTGQGTIIWSIVLFLACLAILFFMYSGFAMAIKRRKETTEITNNTNKDEAEYIILVGSETGHTQRFAKQFFDALVATKKTVFLDQLNKYSTFKNAKHLIVLTATYGEGDAPSNAKKFASLLQKVKQEQKIKYSVVGFGSLMYPDYCKYAIIVDALLQKHPDFVPNLPLFKINNQSFEAFKAWIGQWNENTKHKLKVTHQSVLINLKKLKDFKVVEKTEVNKDNTFLIQLQPKNKSKFQSGDFIAFYPKDDNIERLYSIGKVGNNILLSIKKHEFGICSNQLNNLNIKGITKAKIKRNLDFHFPTYAKEVVMIANGTGIAPFLGMISENNKAIKTHLFWGGRTQTSLKLYSKFIDTAFTKKQLSTFHIAYSQEQEKKIYVQDIIMDKADMLANIIKNEGIIMICGSVAMQTRVVEALNKITEEKLQQPLSNYENNEQIKMDCY